jgi:hypothetical protein
MYCASSPGTPPPADASRPPLIVISLAVPGFTVYVPDSVWKTMSSTALVALKDTFSAPSEPSEENGMSGAARPATGPAASATARAMPERAILAMEISPLRRGVARKRARRGRAPRRVP